MSKATTETPAIQLRWPDGRPAGAYACPHCRQVDADPDFAAKHCLCRWCGCLLDQTRSLADFYQCEACEAKRRDGWQDRQWASACEKAVPWDGQTPLYSLSRDRHFFGADSLSDYLDGCNDETSEVAVEDLRLVLCVPINGRPFSMADYLSDDLPEDRDGPDFAEIDKTVNDWLKAHAPFSWASGPYAVTAESVRAVIGPGEGSATA